MLCGVRHSSTSEAWLHLGLPLCDCIALDQPIKHSKAEVEGILHLPRLGCRLVTPLEDKKGADQAALHKEPEKVAPPFSAGLTHRVVGLMLIMQIHATHVFIVMSEWTVEWPSPVVDLQTNKYLFLSFFFFFNF